MSAPQILLIDTTVLYSGLVYRGLENKVLKSEKYIFLTTEFVITELYRILALKRGLSNENIAKLIVSIPIIVVDCNFIKDSLEEADRLIGFRDKSDVSLVALALTLKKHDGIWSTDADFDVVRNRFKIWKTRELL